jgi:hypothetical protein
MEQGRIKGINTGLQTEIEVIKIKLLITFIF